MDLTHLPLPSPKPLRFSPPQLDELERIFLLCPRPNSALLDHFLKDRPLLSSLDKHLLKLWFQSRRLQEKRDQKLSPLINKNAELKAEHQSLLLRNSQLRNQTLLLNLENQRLKRQLELQLQLSHSGSSSMSTSASVDPEESTDSSGSDDEETLSNAFSNVQLKEQPSPD